MIDKRDVQAFFDRLAPDWDAGMVRNEAVIARILDNAGVCEGCTVLDVACGTGVLFGDYVRRGAVQVTAIDLSPEMAARAAAKVGGAPVTVLFSHFSGSAVDTTADYANAWNLTTIGTHTAGATGNLMVAPLCTGYAVTFSGSRQIASDGTDIQNNGVQPRIEVPV